MTNALYAMGSQSSILAYDVGALGWLVGSKAFPLSGRHMCFHSNVVNHRKAFMNKERAKFRYFPKETAPNEYEIPKGHSLICEGVSKDKLGYVLSGAKIEPDSNTSGNNKKWITYNNSCSVLFKALSRSPEGVMEQAVSDGDGVSIDPTGNVKILPKQKTETKSSKSLSVVVGFPGNDSPPSSPSSPILGYRGGPRTSALKSSLQVGAASSSNFQGTAVVSDLGDLPGAQSTTQPQRAGHGEEVLDQSQQAAENETLIDSESIAVDDELPLFTERAAETRERGGWQWGVGSIAKPCCGWGR